ncbi:MAG TPA: hypothetical protein VGJ14_17095 [Sporichthyaceae bacterium]
MEWVHPPTVHELPAAGAALSPAGEEAALRRWRRFRDGALRAYATDRDNPQLTVRQIFPRR